MGLILFKGECKISSWTESRNTCRFWGAGDFGKLVLTVVKIFSGSEVSEEVDTLADGKDREDQPLRDSLGGERRGKLREGKAKLSVLVEQLDSFRKAQSVSLTGQRVWGSRGKGSGKGG